MNSFAIEIIATYFEGPQDRWGIRLKKPATSEADALFKILKSIPAKKRQNLRKLSLCQVSQTKDEKELPWLAENNGKYYFDEYRMK